MRKATTLHNKLPSLLIVFFLIAGCKPGIITEPKINSKIFAEVDATGTHYYAYFTVKNVSRYDCNISFEPPLQYLTLISPQPFSIAPDASVEAKFEIRNFTPATPCPSPCIIEEVNFRATWPGYNTPGYFVDSKTELRWSTPVTQVYCWVPTSPVGSTGIYYKAPLCVNLSASVAGGGPPYKWKDIGDITNPNDFPIKILVTHDYNTTFPCYSPDNANELNPVFVEIAKGATYPHFGQDVIDYFKICPPGNDDAYIYIQEIGGKHTTDAGGSKWIAIKVTII